jgi:hypothetical protein
MLPHLPLYISILFILTTLATVFLFFWASNYSKPTLIIILSWLFLHTILSLNGFYTLTNTFPPRFALLGAPTLLLFLILFLTKGGRRYIDNLDVKRLTYLHTIRIPVELVLFYLFTSGYVPQLMTFEGRNFDIISGVTAPLIATYAFRKALPNKPLLFIWNIICLALLINILILAIFSAPFTFQIFAFDHPNIAVLYFPFTWLPCCVVPLVLFSHLAAIRQLLKK